MSGHLPPACVDTDGVLVALAYGEESDVPPEARAHLAGCDRCRAALAKLEETRAVMGALPLEEPSAALDDRILAALDAQLAGASLEPFVRLEPAEAPEAAPAPRSSPPSLRALPGSAPPARADAGPAVRATSRRRSWLPAFAAAASVAVVGGGTWLLTDQAAFDAHAPAPSLAKESASSPAAPPALEEIRPPEPVATRSPEPAARAAPPRPSVMGASNEPPARDVAKRLRAFQQLERGAAEKKAVAKLDAPAALHDELAGLGGGGDDRAGLASASREEQPRRAASAPTFGDLEERRQRPDPAPAPESPAAASAAPAVPPPSAPPVTVRPDAKAERVASKDSRPASAPAALSAPPARAAEPEADSVSEAEAGARRGESDPDAEALASRLAAAERELAAGRAANALAGFRAVRAAVENVSGFGRLRDRAVDGELDALMALGRFDEAEQVALRAPAERSRAAGVERVRRARRSIDALEPPAAVAPAGTSR